MATTKHILLLVPVLAVVTQPLPRDGSMAEDHGAPEAGQLPRAWTRDHEERKKYRAKNGSLRNTSTDSKGTTFVILKDHASAPARMERLSPTSKARWEASRNQFVEKRGMPDTVKSFGEISSRQDRPRARPWFVKPIRNGLRKVQNLIKCRPSRAETGLAWRKNGIRFQKEE